MISGSIIDSGVESSIEGSSGTRLIFSDRWGLVTGSEMETWSTISGEGIGELDVTWTGFKKGRWKRLKNSPNCLIRDSGEISGVVFSAGISVATGSNGVVSDSTIDSIFSNGVVSDSTINSASC